MGGGDGGSGWCGGVCACARMCACVCADAFSDDDMSEVDEVAES